MGAPGAFLESGLAAQHCPRRGQAVKAQDLMAKAAQAAASAKVLLDTGDTDGACNRAYYAMFEAVPRRVACLGSRNRQNTQGRPQCL
ncbi:HEPN domain-containing protein [Azovibrio sp.]|uniref:HEPN domain-containing protein n=1 Tax=Azovibrio sp. TaxID=1872673 RepID=UPI003C7756D9